MIVFAFLGDKAKSAQEPIVRVLVLESANIRIRSDGSKPLFVKGLGPNQKKAKKLILQIRNGSSKYNFNGSSWSFLPSAFNLRVKSNDPRGIWLGKRRYRGELRVFVDGDKIKVVNYIKLEKYLKSVVGSEMPKSWPNAALKAQAIAARTYALQQLNKKKIYDINSTISNQVYLGIEAETIRTKKAVSNTDSIVMTYNGNLINAVFHSSSGGRTEDSGSVWRYQMPYLVSVKDFDQDNPKYYWEKKINPSNLKKLFTKIGGLNSIQVLRTSKTGRIITTKAYGPKGQLTINGKDLRRRLGLKSTLAKLEMVPYSILSKPSNKSSPKFNRNKNQLDVPSAPRSYFLLVKGRGAGHGVGMSQWGANGLAQKGANFRQILRHYYSGIQIGNY